MQKISDSTNTANPAGEFTEGNPAAGAPATLLKASWLNAIQRELVALILGAGIKLNASDDEQVLKAIKAIAGVAADFNKLLNKPTTISGYGILDAYTRQEVSNAIGSLVARDFINYAGLEGGELTKPYMRRESDGAVVGLQPRLGFAPIQQGGGIGQLSNPLKIGWSSRGLKLTVDTTDCGEFLLTSNFDPKTKADKATTLAVAKYYVSKFNATKTINVAEGVKPCVPEVREETVENIKGFTEDRVVIYIKSAGVAGENMSEYDYFESRSADAVEDFVQTLEQSEEGELYRPVFMSQNAITLSNKMQIVIRFYGEPTEIHNNYDFVHTMNYYDFGDDKLVLHPEALEALLSRELKYKGSLYPIASIFRTKKFIERGWRITAGQMLKIMWQISEIDLRKRDVLREQLTGVDQAYMSQLINALRDVDEEKINSTYVGAIIDRIFQ